MMDGIDVEIQEESTDSAPTHLGADVLIGMMPSDVLLDETLSRLTSKTEWKAMRVALTRDAICIAKVGEKILRERIPLLEVEKVRQSNIAPRHEESTLSTRPRNGRVVSSLSSASLLPITTLLDVNASESQHVIEVITTKGGYNCGKIYYLRTNSEEQCATWITALKSTIAVARARAAPHPLAKYQRRLRNIYRHAWFQSAIAVKISHKPL